MDGVRARVSHAGRRGARRTGYRSSSTSSLTWASVSTTLVAFAGPWMLGKLMGYTDNLFQSIPTLVGP